VKHGSNETLPLTKKNQFHKIMYRVTGTGTLDGMNDTARNPIKTIHALHFKWTDK
jgi:hypothetical protein